MVGERWGMDGRTWKKLKAVRGTRRRKEKEASLEEASHVHGESVEEYRLRWDVGSRCMAVNEECGVDEQAQGACSQGGFFRRQRRRV